MKKSASGPVIYSPTDLIRYMQSPFASWMDRFHLERPGILTPDEAEAQQLLVAGEGDKHEAAYVDLLKSQGISIAEIAKGKVFSESAKLTSAAIKSQAPVIYQGALELDNFAGYSDFLIRGPNGEYQVWDTKLGRSPKSYYLVQLCCYAEMLTALTGVPCATVGVILVSDQNRLRTTGEALDRREFRTSEFWYYYLQLKGAFLKLMADFDADLDRRPAPGARANHGRWQSHADAWLETTDHLSRVARITSGQIKKLEQAGMSTVAQLANAHDKAVDQMPEGTRLKLVQQARMQLATRARRETDADAIPAFEIISVPAGEKRGLNALPPPDAGDIYYDMEGYPLIVGGLEYLFGACYHQEDKLLFRDWWGHDRAEEKRAFEGFIDWAFARWRENPGMHIYHYAAYEVSAVRRLSTGHATREEEVDQLLRNQVFVDLYQIVRQGILLGEDSYSIKKVERLYRPKRQGEVATAGDSMVEYAKWIVSGEPGDAPKSPILTAIRNYNEDDCRSTAELVLWLRQLQQKNGGAPVISPVLPTEDDAAEKNPVPESPTKGLLLTAAYDGAGKLIRTDFETLGHLLDFHRREDKPMWWRMFDRIAASTEELADDIACLSQIQAVGSPAAEKRSFIQNYSFSPDEDTKIGAGSTVMFTHQPSARLEMVSFDHSAGTMALKLGAKKLSDCFAGQFPRAGALIPDEYVSPQGIPAAIDRAAAAYLKGQHPLVANLLERNPPIPGGADLLLPGEDTTTAAIRIAAKMDHSVLCVQGPPGTGKTYTGARIIASLLLAGKRVGVTSNSHRAIANLVQATGNALSDKRKLVGVKIGGDADDPIFKEFPGLAPVKSGGDALAAYQATGGLAAGTAWPFSRPEWDGVLDYLVVDEAGQVSLANLVGVSMATKNLILLGDQMQLKQPVQGTHPGETGKSALLYYLQDHATIPPNLGIFLDRSFRMHPQVCQFISETVYDGRLMSIPETENQRITLDTSNRLVKKETGIIFIGLEHDGNVQASDEEVEQVLAVYGELIGRSYTDTKGVSRKLALEDFLFISPYNLQVNRLQARLPEKARVGSVDKFQGQEAPVTIFSLGSSFGEYGSRGLAFLLDRNRINVAISRAQCLAIVIGDPRIAQTEASSLNDMTLINLYCRLVGHATSNS